MITKPAQVQHMLFLFISKLTWSSVSASKLSLIAWLVSALNFHCCS
jgi:hypothetical protein